MNHFEPKNINFKKVIEEKLEKQFFMKHIGLKLDEIKPGFVKASLPIIQELKQQNEFLHGGVTATVADVAMGFAAFSLVEVGKGMVTSKLDIAYLRPAINGRIIAEAWVVKPGNIIYYCEASIFCVDNDDNKVLVARGYASMCTIDLP